MTNTSVEQKRPTTTVAASFDVEVDQFWIEYLTRYPDIFGASCGYWLRGVERDKELGWLVWEDDEKCRKGEEAIRAWREGTPLPEYWFRIDRATAIRAWIEGVRRWGADWYYDVDAEREDVVVQSVLLGEVRYG